MACSACGSPVVTFAVPETYRATAPMESAGAAICTRCLTVESDAGPEEEPTFTRVSETFPSDPERAVPLALALGLCSSLATNRREIEALLGAVERAGADPLLVLDRLLADPSVEPAIDLDRRRHQLEQLLY